VKKKFNDKSLKQTPNTYIPPTHLTLTKSVNLLIAFFKANSFGNVLIRTVVTSVPKTTGETRIGYLDKGQTLYAVPFNRLAI
jgi:hypothetical protein